MLAEATSSATEGSLESDPSGVEGALANINAVDSPKRQPWWGPSTPRPDASSVALTPRKQRVRRRDHVSSLADVLEDFAETTAGTDAASASMTGKPSAAHRADGVSAPTRAAQRRARDSVAQACAGRVGVTLSADRRHSERRGRGRGRQRTLRALVGRDAAAGRVGHTVAAAASAARGRVECLATPRRRRGRPLPVRRVVVRGDHCECVPLHARAHCDGEKGEGAL